MLSRRLSPTPSCREQPRKQPRRFARQRGEAPDTGHGLEQGEELTIDATTAIPEPEPRAATPSCYVLVILSSGDNTNAHRVHDAAHRAFIDGLIKQNRILLGGAFAPPASVADAAYVLRSSGVDEARAIAANLVGINPDAIDEAVVVRPRDIS